MYESVASWYIDKSAPTPNFRRSSEAPLLSPKVIKFPLVSKVPPSCGDVSPTRSVLTVLPDAAVILPCASTVIEGIDVDDQ